MVVAIKLKAKVNIRIAAMLLFYTLKKLEYITSGLILFTLVCHISKLNNRIIVNSVQCDSVCKYLLPLHVSVS
jgi:hypothetical protein